MPEETKSENPFSNIPTAPTIEVRTLHGDVQSMSSTGGTTMQVEDVTEMIGRKVTSSPTPEVEGGSTVLFRIIVLVLVILIAALIVGFIMNMGLLSKIPSIGRFFASAPTSTVATSTPLPTPTYIPSSSTVNFDPYADIEPLRFLRIDADATLPIRLSREAAETTEDLLTFSQRISEQLKSIPSSARFIEIQLTKDGEKPADILTLSSLAGISLFPESFMRENFTPNVTAFVYRNTRGSWPGYIYKLLPNKNPRLLTSQIQMLERSPQTTAALFLADPGSATGVFSDGTRSGLPTREQTFSTPGAAIGYAWFERYFVISTSLEGLEEALRRLQG